MECDKNHRYDQKFTNLPLDQGGSGRHRCCGCAYDAGYSAGLQKAENLSIDLEKLPISQAGEVRHKSPHAAYAQGYYDGVKDSYK